MLLTLSNRTKVGNSGISGTPSVGISASSLIVESDSAFLVCMEWIISNEIGGQDTERRGKPFLGDSSSVYDT